MLLEPSTVCLVAGFIVFRLTLLTWGLMLGLVLFFVLTDADVDAVEVGEFGCCVLVITGVVVRSLASLGCSCSYLVKRLWSYVLVIYRVFITLVLVVLLVVVLLLLVIGNSGLLFDLAYINGFSWVDMFRLLGAPIARTIPLCCCWWALTL